MMYTHWLARLTAVGVLAAVLFVVVGCSGEQPAYPTVPRQEGDDLTVWESVQGAWLVSQTRDMASSYVEQLGVLEIAGTSYRFVPTSGTESASAVDPLLQFLFDAPEGEVRIEYVDGVQGSDRVGVFSEYETLAICTFETDSTIQSFLIRVGEHNSLFFHSVVAEVGLWSISRSYGQ